MKLLALCSHPPCVLLSHSLYTLPSSPQSPQNRNDAYDTLILKGIELCLNHLDKHNAAAASGNSTGNSTCGGMRAVINMSVGRPARHEFFASGLRQLAGNRTDVLMFASAGNNGSAALRFPAA
jgi:hypothetical protein